jgi:hypothetical protein
LDVNNISVFVYETNKQREHFISCHDTCPVYYHIGVKSLKTSIINQPLSYIAGSSQLRNRLIEAGILNMHYSAKDEAPK